MSMELLGTEAVFAEDIVVAFLALISMASDQVGEATVATSANNRDYKIIERVNAAVQAWGGK